MPMLDIMGPEARRTLPPAAMPAPVRSDLRVLPMPSLEWNEQVAKETAHLYERVKTVIPAVEWPFFAPYVKAEVDICCTSSNALQIVESLPGDTVIFVPDQYLANYVAGQTKKKIIAWKGACEVHERFTGDELRRYRENEPGIRIIAHPECPPDVIAEADFTGSTAHMIDWVRTKRPKRIVMVTECSMADNVQAELPDVEFVRPCNLCPHMKRITLPKILDSLVYMKEEVVIDPAIAERARASVERMVNLKN